MNPQRTNELLKMLSLSPSKADASGGRMFATSHDSAAGKSLAPKEKSLEPVTKSKPAAKELAAVNKTAVKKKVAQVEDTARSFGGVGQHAGNGAVQGNAAEDAKLSAQQTDAVGLPAGWAWMWDEETMQSYYVDHNTRTTQWKRPKVGASHMSLVGEAAEKKDKNKKTKKKQDAKMQHKTKQSGTPICPTCRERQQHSSIKP